MLKIDDPIKHGSGGRYTFRVASESRTGQHYLVTYRQRAGDERFDDDCHVEFWKCTCPSRQRPCKHVRGVQRQFSAAAEMDDAYSSGDWEQMEAAEHSPTNGCWTVGFVRLSEDEIAANDARAAAAAAEKFRREQAETQKRIRIEREMADVTPDDCIVDDDGRIVVDDAQVPHTDGLRIILERCNRSATELVDQPKWNALSQRPRAEFREIVERAAEIQRGNGSASR